MNPSFVPPAWNRDYASPAVRDLLIMVKRRGAVVTIGSSKMFVSARLLTPEPLPAAHTERQLYHPKLHAARIPVSHRPWLGQNNPTRSAGRSWRGTPRDRDRSGKRRG